MNKRNLNYSVILFLSVIFGCFIGFLFGSKSIILEPLGNIFINMLFVIVVPLVFCTISSSISHITNINRLNKILKYMILVFIVTSLISAAFMLLGVLIFKPSTNIVENIEYTKENIDISSKLVSMITVSDFNMLLSRENMFPLIIFSSLFGLSIRLCKLDRIGNIVDDISKILFKMLNIIMYYAPIGLCAYFATLIGTYGSKIIGIYAKSFMLYTVMAVLYYIIFYSLYAYISYKKKGIKIFYKNIFLSTITSLGTCSSLATLPSNINTAHNMNLHEDVYRLVLPIGSTIHMEGSSMASILKISILFSMFGRTFYTFPSIFLALFISLLSSVVMSGIPGGALIGETLIVSIYNFPPMALPIIATIGWLIDSPGTCLNAVGDIPSVMLINKLVDK